MPSIDELFYMFSQRPGFTAPRRVEHSVESFSNLVAAWLTCAKEDVPPVNCSNMYTASIGPNWLDYAKGVGFSDGSGRRWLYPLVKAALFTSYRVHNRNRFFALFVLSYSVALELNTVIDSVDPEYDYFTGLVSSVIDELDDFLQTIKFIYDLNKFNSSKFGVEVDFSNTIYGNECSAASSLSGLVNCPARLGYVESQTSYGNGSFDTPFTGWFIRDKYPSVDVLLGGSLVVIERTVGRVMGGLVDWGRRSVKRDAYAMISQESLDRPEILRQIEPII